MGFLIVCCSDCRLVQELADSLYCAKCGEEHKALVGDELPPFEAVREDD